MSLQDSANKGDVSTIRPLSSPTLELTVGVVLKEQFVLKEELGRGGMGIVFKALDLRKVEASDREAFVALKVLNIDFRDNPISLIALQRETNFKPGNVFITRQNEAKVFDFGIASAMSESDATVFYQLTIFRVNWMR